ncbi:hypothetical protein [Piscinibacter sp. XHJ-5]|uniref:hypothetical protein n=1 Tax=Piscinibacter sp. XHJ-5 TaxID=3037797 RepID=UPI002453715B|nr:hypothetical protein [Piscinibacter sp. XHJ-5]
MREVHSNVVRPWALALIVATLAAGCASGPGPAGRPPAPAPADCSAVATEIARVEEARRAAAEKHEGAWKAVIPFAVAARYASGKAAAGEADRQLSELHAESHRQGCASERG